MITCSQILSPADKMKPPAYLHITKIDKGTIHKGFPHKGERGSSTKSGHSWGVEGWVG